MKNLLKFLAEPLESSPPEPAQKLQVSVKDPTRLVRKHKTYDTSPIFVQITVDGQGLARTKIRNKICIIHVVNWPGVSHDQEKENTDV